MASPIRNVVAFLWHARARFLLIACGVLVGLVLAGGTVVVIRQMHQNALAAAERELSNMSLAVAEQTDHGFQAVETVELSLIEHMRQLGIDTPEEFVRQMSPRDVQSSLRDRIVGVPQVEALSLIDRNGRLLNFSRDRPLPDINVADRDYFQALSGNDPPTSFISAPVESRSTGASTFYIVHRFSAPDGAFIGLVVVAIEPTYFEQIFSKMSHDSAASISLQRRDGVLLARYPPIPGSNGRSTAQTGNFQRLIAATDHGIVHIRSMLDGQDRLLAPRGLSHYPILVIAGTTSQQAMGGWRDQSLLIVVSGVLLELFLCGLIVLSIRQMRAQQLLAAGATEKLASDKARMLAESNLVLADLKLRHAEESKRSEQALNTQAMRFELALRNMQQGLMMFDDVGRLLVVNRPFCRLFGLEPDALIAGMSYAEVTGRIVELGNITERDMRRYRETRAKLISGNEAATATWEVSDGRAFTVTHQAMEGGWLSTYEDITEHRKTAARIAHLANHDALTDLANRMLFHERLEHGLTYARRGHLLALHCLDLDQFKTVNDTLGHPIGDRLLQAVAGRLLGHLRETDTVARLGGDEFAIVQTAIGSPTDASRLADKLIALIEAPFEIDGNQIVIGTSIGIAFAPHDGLDADQLLKCADLALYRAKVDGRGIYRLFHADMDASMQARRALELDLRGALRDGQFELF